MIGAVFAVLAAALLVLSLPDALSPCTPVTGNIDGDGGAACGSGPAWDAQSVVGAGVASICGLLAVICLAIGLRRSRRYFARGGTRATATDDER